MQFSTRYIICFEFFGRLREEGGREERREDANYQNEDIAAHKSSADHDGRYYTKSQSKLIKFKDIQIKATQDGSATSKIDTHNGLIIPVLADPGSRAWEIFVGLQYATDTLILSGSGVSAGYTYTVRLFYFE